jgi:hypothetical protein
MKLRIDELKKQKKATLNRREIREREKSRLRDAI